MKSFKNIGFSIFFILVFLFVLFNYSCKQDTCKVVNCLNGGTCNGGTCQCPTGWTGNLCQTSAFGGNWIGTDHCDSINYNLSISIEPYSTDTLKYIIHNPHGYIGQVIGARSGDSIIKIASQICDTVLFSGIITLNSVNSFSFSYSAKDTANGKTIQCSGNYSRQ